MNEKILTVAQIGEKMFVPGCEHVRRQELLGRHLQEKTLTQNRKFMELIIERYGHYGLSEISVPLVMEPLMRDPHGSSWKNHYVSVFESLYEEQFWHAGSHVTKPAFPRFAQNSVKAGCFTGKEIETLFGSYSAAVWKSYAHWLCFLTALSCGLRLGEARAVLPRQFLFGSSLMVVDGFCRENGERTTWCKGGSAAKPKARFVYVPQRTLTLVRNFMAERGLCEESGEFLFGARGRALRRETLERAFKAALIRAGINIRGRKLVPHSLRYTYVTRMCRHTDLRTVQALVGHNSAQMTEYYVASDADCGMQVALSASSAAEKLFS